MGSYTGEHWHREVPGTRWFRADLHLHTIDDPTVQLPTGIEGERIDNVVRDAYAQRFLDSAVDQGIEVLGLTPHRAFMASGISSTLDIVELWKTGTHESSGRPYRELVYAVYPGFEPSFNDGNPGLHLIWVQIGSCRILSSIA